MTSERVAQMREEIKCLGIPAAIHHDCGAYHPNYKDILALLDELLDAQDEIDSLRMALSDCLDISHEIRKRAPDDLWYAVRPMVESLRLRVRAALSLTDDCSPGAILRLERDEALAQVGALREALETTAFVRVLCGRCGRTYSRCDLCDAIDHDSRAAGADAINDPCQDMPMVHTGCILGYVSTADDVRDAK